MEPNYWIFTGYLSIGLLAGFCAGIILAFVIQRIGEKRRLKYEWPTPTGWR